MVRKYKEVKADYFRLKEICGGNEIPDYCGAWCNNDMMDSLLDDPTKSNAATMFSSLITTYLESGYEAGITIDGVTKIDIMDSEVYAILVRNGDKPKQHRSK